MGGGVRRTRWNRDVAASLPAFLRTEAASAAVMVGAVTAALIWANIDAGYYESVWRTNFAVGIGGIGITRDVRTWINSGLMTLFFLVVGLEARREIDLGDLRDRRRFILPVAAGIVGMVVPAGLFLAVNLPAGAGGGWGAAMSTDTALSMGLVTLIGRGLPQQMRAFLLTVFVVDDLVGLIVIVVAYTDGVDPLPLGVALGVFALFVAGLAARVDLPPLYGLLGVVMWGALLASGVEPVVTGLAIGLAAWAYPPTRGDLEHATGRFRLFREQPTPERARWATASLISALSPNARLQRFYHPWTSYVIVPLFGLANAGVDINGRFLVRAYTAPVTVGIVLGYVVGKPVAVAGTSWLISRMSRGRIRPPVGWAAVLAGGTIAGIGFTVALLISSLAFEGRNLDEAKLGILTAASLASALTWGVVRMTAALPPARRARAIYGKAGRPTDLVPPVDPGLDHIRGPDDATVTVVEYADFECPHCGHAEPALRRVLGEVLDVRFVWRHLPLTDVHPQAQLAAEAAEAAGAQGAFWRMHDVLLTRRGELGFPDLLRYSEKLGLDQIRFRDDLTRHVHARRIARDVESADLSGVSGTPTFVVNGERLDGIYDVEALAAAIEAARLRAAIGSTGG